MEDVSILCIDGGLGTICFVSEGVEVHIALDEISYVILDSTFQNPHFEVNGWQFGRVLVCYHISRGNLTTLVQICSHFVSFHAFALLITQKRT